MSRTFKDQNRRSSDSRSRPRESRCVVTAQLRAEAQAYQGLCDRARRVNVPTSLDDRRSPRTVAGLLAAVEQAEVAA